MQILGQLKMLRNRVDQRPIEVTKMLARALRHATKSPENQ